MSPPLIWQYQGLPFGSIFVSCCLLILPIVLLLLLSSPVFVLLAPDISLKVCLLEISFFVRPFCLVVVFQLLGDGILVGDKCSMLLYGTIINKFCILIYLFSDFLTMLVEFCKTCFCKLVLINQTIKGQRYQHVLALCAIIVHKGNIENTIFGNVFYVCRSCVSL